MFTIIPNEKQKTSDIHLTPKFLEDLGQLIQIVFPIQTQNFVPEGKIICVLESNRRLMTLKNPVAGAFRSFNTSAEMLAERYTADTPLFTIQPMSKDEFDKEMAEKNAKAAAKKKKPIPEVVPPPNDRNVALDEEILARERDQIRHGEILQPARAAPMRPLPRPLDRFQELAAARPAPPRRIFNDDFQPAWPAAPRQG